MNYDMNINWLENMSSDLSATADKQTPNATFSGGHAESQWPVKNNFGVTKTTRFSLFMLKIFIMAN